MASFFFFFFFLQRIVTKVRLVLAFSRYFVIAVKVVPCKCISKFECYSLSPIFFKGVNLFQRVKY